MATGTIDLLNGMACERVSPSRAAFRYRPAVSFILHSTYPPRRSLTPPHPTMTPTPPASPAPHTDTNP